MDTKPLEFRVTAPVCPGNFQVILYGELLDEYIAVDLIGIPLLNAVQTKPDVILVRNDLLLGINSKQEIPTVRIMRAEEPLMKKTTEPQALNPIASSYQPAKVYTSEKFSEKLQIITEQLQVVFSERDLIEPFDRIQKACIDVHNRKIGNM